MDDHEENGTRQEAPSPQEVKTQTISLSPEKRWPVALRELLETLLLALLIFLAARSAMQNFRVEGFSMDPSLKDGEYILVNKLAYAHFDVGIFDFLPFVDAGENSEKYLFGGPGRGDVVVFEAPIAPSTDFIKRIIGKPGDTVEVKDGIVYLNDRPLEEDYARGPTNCVGRWCGPITLGEGEYYVLGDNRGGSSDSRLWGTVPGDDIIGKAWFAYWPFSEVGLAPNHSVSYATE